MDAFDAVCRKYPRTLATLMVTRGMTIGEACSMLQMVQARIEGGVKPCQGHGWIVRYAYQFRRWARTTIPPFGISPDARKVADREIAALAGAV